MNPVKEQSLPSAPDAELAVLSAMMIDARGADEVIAIITSEATFFEPANALVFQAMKKLYAAGQGIDMITVSQQLRAMGKLEEAGGDRRLVDISTYVSSSAHVEYHARILLQKHIARMVINFSSQVISLAYDDSTDMFDLLSRWQKEFDKVVDLTQVGRVTASYADSLQRLKESIEIITANRDKEVLVGIDTGFQRTNRYTGGYRNQDLIILAARPGMGKTAKVLKTALA
jgi:replicative DNA helicase